MDSNSLEITLRSYKLSDAEDFLMYAGDDRVTQFTRWNTFTSKEQALSYINDFCLPHPFCKSICLNDRSIGFVFIKPHGDDNKCRAEVGYALAAEYWGQGIATRAVKMAITDGFKEFTDLVGLQALVLVENKGSLRPCLVHGFLEHGKESHYFPMFGKHKLRKVIPDNGESRGEIHSTQIPWE